MLNLDFWKRPRKNHRRAPEPKVQGRHYSIPGAPEDQAKPLKRRRLFSEPGFFCHHGVFVPNEPGNRGRRRPRRPKG